MAAASTKISFTFIKILTGSDLSRRRLPMMAAVSANPGPVLWLTGCGHGDEVGGMVIIQEIFKIIRKTSLSRGALYAFPLQAQLRRYLSLVLEIQKHPPVHGRSYI